MSLKKNDKRVKKFLDVIRCYVAVIWVLQVEDCLRKTQTSIYAIMRRKKKSRSMVMLRQIVWLINFMNESVGIFVQASNRRQPASWHNIILGKYITQNRFCIHSFIALDGLLGHSWTGFFYLCLQARSDGASPNRQTFVIFILPSTGFSQAHKMERHRYIYCLSSIAYLGEMR